MNNIADYLKIAVIAFVGVWLINRGLTAMGLGQYATSASKQAS
jgi:hypothetical protein